MSFGLLRMFALALLVPVAGCTADQVLGTAYDMGRQHSCRQDAEHKPNESMEDFKCITAQQEDRGQSWDDYKQARAEELGRQGE